MGDPTFLFKESVKQVQMNWVRTTEVRTKSPAPCQDSSDDGPQPNMGPPSERTSKYHDPQEWDLDSESASLCNGADAPISETPSIQRRFTYAEIRIQEWICATSIRETLRKSNAEGDANQPSKLDWHTPGNRATRCVQVKNSRYSCMLILGSVSVSLVSVPCDTLAVFQCT